MRLKSCAYCGRMHPIGVECALKPKYKPKDQNSQPSKIRSSYAWQQKRESIKRRDNYLCQCCLRNFPGTLRQIEYDHLSVHHIVSLEEDSEKAFDDDNLITLCDRHHEAAEEGKIAKEDLLKIIRGQAATGNLAQ